MTAWWHLLMATGLLGLSGASEGRELTRDTAWWAAPEPQWRSRLLPALMPPASTYWGSPSAQYRQLDQPRPLPQQQQQHRQAVFQPQQPFYPSQPQYYPPQPQQQPQRARYLRDPQDDPYRNYNPRQPAPWSVQVGTSLSVRDDDARGAASRRFYVHSQRDEPRWP
jgi:hypothetical protein